MANSSTVSLVLFSDDDDDDDGGGGGGGGVRLHGRAAQDSSTRARGWSG